MRTVRSMVFETNSSSMHSVCVVGETRMTKGRNRCLNKRSNLESDVLYLSAGDYGWGVESYASWEDKAAYLMTSLLSSADLTASGRDRDMSLGEINARMDEVPAWRRLKGLIKDYMGYKDVKIDDPCGHIDHQSQGLPGQILDETDDRLLHCLFDERVVLHISNDNGGEDLPGGSWL